MRRSVKRTLFLALVVVASLTMSGVGDARWHLFDENFAVDLSPLQICPDRVSMTIAHDVLDSDVSNASSVSAVVHAEDVSGSLVLNPTTVVLPTNHASDATETRKFSRGFTFAWTDPLPVGTFVTLFFVEEGTGEDGFVSGDVVPCSTDATADIDVRPGDPVNGVDPSETSTIRVAVLTTQDHPAFDAADVRRKSVRFGRVGDEAKPKRTRLKDVDGDGDKDLVLRFRQSKTEVGCGDLSANLRGKLAGGGTFDGTDYINTIGCP